jgi:hypothetical protein
MTSGRSSLGSPQPESNLCNCTRAKINFLPSNKKRDCVSGFLSYTRYLDIEQGAEEDGTAAPAHKGCKLYSTESKLPDSHRYEGPANATIQNCLHLVGRRDCARHSCSGSSCRGRRTPRRYQSGSGHDDRLDVEPDLPAVQPCPRYAHRRRVGPEHYDPHEHHRDQQRR